MSSDKLCHRLDPWGILAFLIPFSVYLLTLAPSVTFFDSGEFITAIQSLGSAHSPGYPTFINYAKPFTYLPFGSIAFRVNVATAFSSAMACYAAYLLAAHMLLKENREDVAARFYAKTAALSGALVFAFSARLWLQSNHDKPYPLVSFLTGMVFYLLLLWRDGYRDGDERPWLIYLGAFLSGLSFGAHQTTVLMLPAYAVLILSMDPKLIMRVRELLLALAFALIGFSIHLHLIIRATTNPLLNWGDPKSYSQFMWHLLRKGYPVEKPARDFSLLWAQMNAFNVPHEFTYVGMFFLLLGLLVFFRKRTAEVTAYLVGIAAFLAVIAGYFNTPREVIFLTEEFFTPLYLLSAVFVAMGLHFVVCSLLKRLPARGSRTYLAKVAGMTFFLLLPVTVCGLHYVENDQRENYVAFEYGSNTLRSLPQGAVLYTWGDSGAFPLWYLQGVEKMREDLILLHTPHLVFDWYLNGFPELFRNSILRRIDKERMAPEEVLKFSIAEMMNTRPVVIDFSTRYSVPLEGLGFLQRGITYQLSRKGNVQPPELSTWDLYITRGLYGDMFFRDLDTGKAISIYANAHLESAETLLRLGRLPEASLELNQVQSISPEMSGQIVQLLNAYGVR